MLRDVVMEKLVSSLAKYISSVCIYNSGEILGRARLGLSWVRRADE